MVCYGAVAQVTQRDLQMCLVQSCASALALWAVCFVTP